MKTLAQGDKQCRKREELKMTHLKEENVKQCFSLLRNFIGDEPEGQDHKLAILALDRLQEITAGAQQFTLQELSADDSGCVGKPRAYGSPYK
jgi:hypothetical protein